jgi:hypothetical protein
MACCVGLQAMDPVRAVIQDAKLSMYAGRAPPAVCVRAFVRVCVRASVCVRARVVCVVG